MSLTRSFHCPPEIVALIPRRGQGKWIEGAVCHALAHDFGGYRSRVQRWLDVGLGPLEALARLQGFPPRDRETALATLDALFPGLRYPDPLDEDAAVLIDIWRESGRPSVATFAAALQEGGIARSPGVWWSADDLAVLLGDD